MLQLARPEDRESVNALAVQVHNLHMRWRPDLFEPCELLYSRERFRDAVTARELYVAKADGIVVGYVLLKIRNVERTGIRKHRLMVVDEFCVHEAVRGQGLGKQIMADVLALARAFGCEDVELRVYPQNDDAVGFYQKCGFTIRSIEMQRKV